MGNVINSGRLLGACGAWLYLSGLLWAQQSATSPNAPQKSNSTAAHAANSEANIAELHKLVMDRDLDTTVAETKVQLRNSEYETVKRLYLRGASSQQEVKHALYELNIAQIELRRAKIDASDLADYEKTTQLAALQIELANLDYEWAFANYELMKRLYQKSSVSKQRLLYSQVQARIARLNLAAAQVIASSKSDVEKRFQLIDLAVEKARAKYKFLKTVHESNQALFAKGRISKQEFLRSQQALEKSQLELEAAEAAASSNVET